MSEVTFEVLNSITAVVPAVNVPPAAMVRSADLSTISPPVPPPVERSPLASMSSVPEASASASASSVISWPAVVSAALRSIPSSALRSMVPVPLAVILPVEETLI